MRIDSRKPTFLNLFLRHLFDFIDVIPFIGLIVMWNTKQTQRIGDIIAKTIVVDK